VRLGIRGLLAAGLAGLLAVAGVIAALLVVRVVAAEAERQVAEQQRRRALAVATQLRTACSHAGDCGPALLDTMEQARAGDLVELLAIGSPLEVLAGRPEMPGATRDPLLVDALQTGRPVWSRVVREELHPRGAGIDQHVVVPVTLDDGRRLLLRFTFDLDELYRAVADRQRVVLLYLAFDFLVVLLFGMYLGGRYLVRPVHALTRVTADVAGGALDPQIVPSIEGPAEIARLADAFRAMVERLRDQRNELERRVEELRATRDDLVRSEKLATVGKLAAGVAHEIGNPLSAVLGFVEYLRDGREVTPELQGRLLERMDRELTRMGDSIRRLLDFSRPSPPHPQREDLAAIISGAVDLVRFQRSLKQVEIAVEAEACPAVLVDPGRLRQVFVNLLLNAADALAGKGHVWIRVAPDGGGVRATVCDDGPGVAPDARTHLFDPFFTTKPTGSGTGLGLAISQQIVEEAGGRLFYEDGAAPGATFAVWLPAVQPVEA
jgi:signal transduction histidine kinase